MLSGCARCRDGTEQARTGANTGGLKVGDRVRSKAPHYGEGGEEAVGTIVEASAYGMWRVVFPQPSTVAFCTVLEAHLTRVEETPAVQEASPFKVGDTVRVVKRNPAHRHTDSTGRIGEIEGAGVNDAFRVRYEDTGGWDEYPADCLERFDSKEQGRAAQRAGEDYSLRRITELILARDIARAAHANAVERANLESHNMMGVAARAERAEARVKVLEARARDVARILEGK